MSFRPQDLYIDPCRLELHRPTAAFYVTDTSDASPLSHSLVALTLNAGHAAGSNQRETVIESHFVIFSQQIKVS